LIAFDNLSTGIKDRVSEDVLFVQGDIRDESLLLNVFKEFKISTVINLAGLKSPEESFRNSDEYFEVNAHAVKSLLRISKEFNVSAFIQSSSSSVYGNSEKPKLEEASKTNPISPYGESKKMAEKYLIELLEGSSTRGVSLRYFNVVGALESSLRDTSSFNIFPKTIERIRNGKPPIIFGTNYPTPDGTCIRDYIHVGDIAEGHILVAQKIKEKQLPFSLNLGIGRGYSVREIITAIMFEMNFLSEVLEMEPRKGDPATVIADTTLFNNLFDWRPLRTLTDMVESSI
jgi:UDP-glucose 4-epimerase